MYGSRTRFPTALLASVPPVPPGAPAHAGADPCRERPSVHAGHVSVSKARQDAGACPVGARQAGGDRATHPPAIGVSPRALLLCWERVVPRPSTCCAALPVPRMITPGLTALLTVLGPRFERRWDQNIHLDDYDDVALLDEDDEVTKKTRSTSGPRTRCAACLFGCTLCCDACCMCRSRWSLTTAACAQVVVDGVMLQDCGEMGLVERWCVTRDRCMRMECSKSHVGSRDFSVQLRG